MVNEMGWTDKKDMNTEKLPIMTYEERREKIRQQVKSRLAQEKAFLCCSIAGNPKTGKSGTAMDCRTDEEKKKGMKIRVLDLDDGHERQLAKLKFRRPHFGDVCAKEGHDEQLPFSILQTWHP